MQNSLVQFFFRGKRFTAYKKSILSKHCHPRSWQSGLVLYETAANCHGNWLSACLGGSNCVHFG
ncbi:hypothetical protein MESS2_p40002 [Mesorhizobium metallidurans STM 2683]|uniref:Uncharacterized protein n=1 Tax=Mesorhizobium metallidurans STM 2683 TaxID=1297569 RepID=M5EZL4_9HYPH|nr:hypothetical protein MESS2_p40002 [Mesorhizobium metallidurans STM 2683]